MSGNGAGIGCSNIIMKFNKILQDPLLEITELFEVEDGTVVRGLAFDLDSELLKIQPFASTV